MTDDKYAALREAAADVIQTQMVYAAQPDSGNAGVFEDASDMLRFEAKAELILQLLAERDALLAEHEAAKGLMGNFPMGVEDFMVRGDAVVAANVAASAVLAEGRK